MKKDAINKRADALLKEMTLAEKAAQMVQVPYQMVSHEEALEWARRGAGSFLHVLGDDARELQQTALHTRLGIPLMFGIDAIHGHGLNEHGTIFPSQLACACSWDSDLLRRVGRVTGREVATDGLHWTFSPVLCLGRDTRWGRVDETFGEDPFLAGVLGAAIVTGYRGDGPDDERGILACAKHYIGYGEAVGGRDSCDTQMTFRKLRETFLPPFRAAVEAGCDTVMTAYGSIDGTPFTASRTALHDILRGEAGFTGMVVTDWDNVQSLVTRQHAAADIGEASRMAVRAGNDMMMTTLDFYEAIIKSVQDGLMEEKELDVAVRRILRLKLSMGLFEKPEKRGVPGCIGCKEHLGVSLRAARESVTLLKNDGALPFAEGVRSVAVIGPNADDIRAQYGDWTYLTHPTPDPARVPVRPYVTVREGIEAIAAESGMRVVYARGCDAVDPSDAALDEAEKAAAGCDAIVLVLGDNISQFGEWRDRADLTLSGAQEALFMRLRALNKPLTTVLLSSKPLCIPRIAEETDALLAAFNGGMFGGQAVAEALFGRIEPAGRLPISFPRHVGQLPIYYNYLPGWHGDKYNDLPEGPQYAFGEGLSYTRFEYTDLAVGEDALSIAVTVTNAGEREGTETVQVYFRDVVSSVITPIKQLVAFHKVTLAPGAAERVAFRFAPKDFALVLPNGRRVTEEGEIELMIGHSSRDCDLLKGTGTVAQWSEDGRGRGGIV